ncbi:glycosyltransferase family 4 protein [Synechococcus sp. A10-1-5-1]|uniref:glycosyltransferase family 4 protein n=1 Tax=Synechococcus sp. A10-1-5-1 TaxID=2936507 RepID=UPI002000AFCB|nr:glycosyltransferase family 1 protein [Synechococcus sp. A10-1-5-1]UPM49238.1 glycosyltransferase family 4 protein [Synechococcus sp. A10-1-5-1]
MLLLNYKPVLHHPTGIGVYANAVLPVLQDFEHVVIPGGGSGGGKQRLRRLAWSQFQLPRLAKQVKADLIFTPAPEGYLGKQVVPQVVMVHDLRPLSHPECSLQSLYFKNWVPQLLRQSRHIITNSTFTSLEICKATGVPEDKISAIPLGYDSEHFYPSETKQTLHHRPYLLHVGQAYPHKNLQRLIHAFNAIEHRFPAVDLVLLGKPHPSETQKLQQLTSELGLSTRVIFKSYVSYGDLPNWYRGALAFVYPSLWEGFGLPILEAMACGCPVITSLGSGTQEVAGTHALLVDPFSAPDIQEKISQLLDSKKTRDAFSRLGLERTSQFSWDVTTRRTAAVMDTILALA